MIIRPLCRKEYVALPNSLFNDRRLSADTRAMIALLLSKPRGWELRTRPLMTLLAREDEVTIGWTRLSRMLREATEAGYMARSEKQMRKGDGTWGKYDYYVGMPPDVLHATQSAGVATAPHLGGAHKGCPNAAGEHTNHKERSSKSTDSKNLSHHHPQHLLLGGTAKRNPIEERKTSVRRLSEKPEVVQQRVASRLGLGDVAKGWLIFGGLTNARRDTLTALERSGRLTEGELLAARATTVIAAAAKRSTR